MLAKFKEIPISNFVLLTLYPYFYRKLVGMDRKEKFFADIEKGYAMKGDYQRFLADATPFMEFFSTIVVAWQWLVIGTNAQQALVMGANEYSEEFYESKLHTMKFYFKYELPKTQGLSEILMDNEALTLNTDKKIFA